MTQSDPSSSRLLTIAIDGPAAAGKGTLAQRLARFYNLAYLDTGILYRGVGYLLATRNHDISNQDAAIEIAKAFHLDQIEGCNIRTPDVAKAASQVAKIQPVRDALFAFQQDFAKAPPKGKKGAILDGRDIGTVICPDADVKFFVSASPETRAHRRWLELRAQDPSLSENTVLEDIKRRDQRDSSRDAAPLKPASDAHIIDTSTKDADEVFTQARRIIDKVLG